MCETCDLILIRHEETAGNVALVRSFSGDASGFTREVVEQPSFDWPLTPLGCGKSAVLGKWLCGALDNLSGFRFAVSGARRTQETARLALPQAAWECDDLLRGRNWGGIESVPWGQWLDYCAKHGVDRLPAGFREAYPHGETMLAVLERANLFLRNMRQKTVVVTHGEVVQMFRMILEAIPEREYPRLDCDGNHIRNGQVLWYTKRNTGSDGCSPSFLFKRIHCQEIDTGWMTLPAGR